MSTTPKEGRLAGRVVLVTGAGQGVGRGIALALAREGAHVAAAGRTVAKCEAVVAEIEQADGTAVALACDIADPAQIRATVAATAAHFGGLDALVNNAQSSVQRLLTETTPEDVDLAWRSGPLATLHGMQAALPLLR